MAAGKTCTRCKWWKPLELFRLDATKPDNRETVCRSCKRASYAIAQAKAIPISDRSREIRERIARERRLPLLRQALAKLQTASVRQSHSEVAQ